MLTPDTLRYIGQIVAQLTSQIHEVTLAYRATDTRAHLQKQELMRLSGKCQEMQALVARLEGPRRTAAEDRMKRVQEEQKVLLGRLDRMLQGLMERASPELSEHETKWFEELKRMKEEIVGNGRYDEGSLVARTRLVRVNSCMLNCECSAFRFFFPSCSGSMSDCCPNSSTFWRKGKGNRAKVCPPKARGSVCPRLSSLENVITSSTSSARSP